MRRLLLGPVLAAVYCTGALANDFPTQARVEFVLQCMNWSGGQSYDTLYPCICTVDRIAAQMPYAEYAQAETLTYLYRTPGERGGVFRDAAPESRKRVKDLGKLRKKAEAACFVKQTASNATE